MALGNIALHSLKSRDYRREGQEVRAPTQALSDEKSTGGLSKTLSPGGEVKSAIPEKTPVAVDTAGGKKSCNISKKDESGVGARGGRSSASKEGYGELEDFSATKRTRWIDGKWVNGKTVGANVDVFAMDQVTLMGKRARGSVGVKTMRGWASQGKKGLKKDDRGKRRGTKKKRRSMASKNL